MKRDVITPLTVDISAHDTHLNEVQVRHDTSPLGATSVDRWYKPQDVELIPLNSGRVRGSLLKPKGRPVNRYFARIKIMLKFDIQSLFRAWSLRRNKIHYLSAWFLLVSQSTVKGRICASVSRTVVTKPHCYQYFKPSEAFPIGNCS